MKKEIIFLFLVLSSFSVYSQCLQVLDGAGVFTDNPTFVSCTPGDYTVFIQPDRNMGNYTIVWGDGSPNSTGASLATNTSVSHVYASGTANYNISITDNSTSCTITGLVVLERNPLASIQLPAGDDNFGCTPVQFRFINSSTQISSNTTFTWDFGDGSPTETYNFTNLGDTVLHTYLPGVGVQSCDLNVTLTATNLCGSSTASFFPLKVWDLDEAQITPSATLLCYPDTIVQYTNSTIRNCFPEGNQSQRYERWNFGDYWGLGRDSIIEWRPWNPPIINPPPIGYPGLGTYFVTLQDSSFCGVDDVTISITITNSPTAAISANKDTICEGETVRFTNNSIGGANTFEWDYDKGGGFVTRNGGAKNVTYNNSGDYTIRLVAAISGAQGCTDTAEVDLHVLPSPVADFTFDNNNQCDSMVVNLTNSSTGTIVSYQWDFGNGNTFNGVNPPTQLFNSPNTYNVSLTVSNSRGCSNTITKQVRVRQTPVSNFSVNSVCLNEVATFTDLSSSGGDPIVSYSWDFGDGSVSSNQNPTHLYTAFGMYTVVQIVDNGSCKDTSELVVTVENKPTAAFSSTPDNGCSRLTVNFVNQSTPNATNFSWNFGDGSPIVYAEDTVHTFTNTSNEDTSFVVTFIASTTFGCSDTITDTINVYPIPTPSFTSDAVADCGPVSVNFTNTTVGSNLSYFWNFGDGSPIVSAVNPSHVFENKTLFINNYDVQLIVESANGCRDTTSQVIQIYPEPIFTFAAVPDSGCSPLSVTFPSVVGAVDYQWDFGDGAVASGPTPTHVYINNTTNNQSYIVRLIAQNSFGCTDTTFGSVLVYPNPTSSFSLDTNVGCQPLPIEITNTSTGANSFSWDFGDGSTSTNNNANFIKTFSNTSSLTLFNQISLITETVNGCKDTSTKSVEIHPFIEAIFTSDSVGCSPYSVPFNNQSFGGQNYLWNFGDGGTSSAINPNHTFTNSSNANQTYTTQLIAMSPKGCLDTAVRNILVYPKPTASYSLSTNQGCQPLPVSFTNSSSLADSCVWNYGDLDTFNLCSPTNTHTYTNTTSFFPINYQSQLVVYSVNGCADTLQRTITVNPQVIADFDSVMSGCSPLSSRFQNQSVGAQNFSWEFGDGGNSFNRNANHTYFNNSLLNSSHTIRLIASSQFGCADTVEQTIEVYAKPNADFTATPNSGCEPLLVNFQDNTQLKDSCVWNFGDGTPLLDSCFQNRSHTYVNSLSSVPINVMAQLFVFTDEGCRDTANEIITVNPRVEARFSVPDSGCSPFAVSFQNQSIGAQSYSWTFGDGASSQQLTPSHIYQNNGTTTLQFTARLVVTNAQGCTSDSSITITVFPKPTADFSVNVSEGCQPLTVQFTNNSLIKDKCDWRFGDGNLNLDDCSLLSSHTYTNTLSLVPLTYNSELIITTVNGCTDTLSRPITVKPQVIADFSSDSAACSPLNATFRSQSFGASNYAWDYGDGGMDNGMITTHQFSNTGITDSIYTVRLIASSVFNCEDTAYKNITVYPTPLVGFTVSPTTQEFPNSTVSVINSTNPDNWNYLWDFGDTTTSSLKNPGDHTYKTWGVYTIKLKAISPNCEDSIEKVVTIDAPTPIADFGDSTVGCEPLEVTFNNKSQYGNTYEWDFGDGNSSNSENPTHIYFNKGTYTVTLKVNGFTNNKQDQISKADYIVVNKTPIANFITNKTNVFIPNDPVVFSNRSEFADDYTWEFGDGNISTEQSPIHYFTDVGEYEVLLIASTVEGCVDTAIAPNTILAELEGRIRVPNAFTPSQNGSNGGTVNIQPSLGEFNDVFYAKVEGSVKYELNIFNKWGELLFVSKDINIGWDGYYNGKLAQQDVYVWKVTVQFADGTTKTKVGDLMLLR